jgi:hypothetical protein
MGRTCGRDGRQIKEYRVLFEKPKGTGDHLRNLGVCLWTAVMWFRIGTNGDLL